MYRVVVCLRSSLTKVRLPIYSSTFFSRNNPEIVPLNIGPNNYTTASRKEVFSLSNISILGPQGLGVRYLTTAKY